MNGLSYDFYKQIIHVLVITFPAAVVLFRQTAAVLAPAGLAALPRHASSQADACPTLLAVPLQQKHSRTYYSNEHDYCVLRRSTAEGACCEGSCWPTSVGLQSVCLLCCLMLSVLKLL